MGWIFRDEESEEKSGVWKNFKRILLWGFMSGIVVMTLFFIYGIKTTDEMGAIGVGLALPYFFIAGFIIGSILGIIISIFKHYNSSSKIDITKKIKSKKVENGK